MHVRKGDTVVVISGNDRGKTGTVMRVLRDDGRVVVEGVNLRWRHQKPTQQNPKGQRSQRECAIHASNVLRYDEKQEKGVRARPDRAWREKKAAAKSRPGGRR